jgi:PilZ domain
MAIAASFQTVEEDPQGRRHWPRKRLRLSVAADVAGQGGNVLVHDISVSGLLLEAQTALTIGEFFTVELLHDYTASAKVIWSSGNFHGCEFTRQISPGTVSAALLQSPPPETTTPSPIPASPPVPRQVSAANHDPADEPGRGSLSTSARIQIVITITLALWSLIFLTIA